VASPNRQRWLALLVVPIAAAIAPASAGAQTYGKLIVRHEAAPAATLDTSFASVRPPGAFLLVVTEPQRTPLDFSWSLRCTNAKRREAGGASGEATVSSGHWVKTVRPDWIKHPVACSGRVVGSAGSSPVLVRIFAD
jgi:hypothetical protein